MLFFIKKNGTFIGPSRSKRRKLNEQIDDDFEMPYQSLVLLHREDVEIGPNNAVGILNNSATFSKCRFSYEESQFLQGKEINFRYANFSSLKELSLHVLNRKKVKGIRS